LFALWPLLLAHCPWRLERLRETKLNLALMQAVVCREWRAGIQILRNQKLRRIQKISVINRQCATQRSLDAKAEADRVTPAHTEILGVQVFNEIAGRCNRFRMKDVAN